MLSNLDICSGIGGFALGCQRAGIKTAAFCENEPFCQQILNKQFPDVPIIEDAKELTYERYIAAGYERPDTITAGFPCQPYSRGHYKRAGRKDDRDLSQEIVRIVDEFKPAVSVLENVEGFADIGLYALVDDLETIGYCTKVLSLPACAVGLPTLERHLWIISSPDEIRLQGCIETTVSKLERIQEQFQGSHKGLPDRWSSSKSRVCRVGERLSEGLDKSDSTTAHRIKALGNAVDPHIPQLIGEAIKVNYD